jgi:hypothetical protein
MSTRISWKPTLSNYDEADAVIRCWAKTAAPITGPAPERVHVRGRHADPGDARSPTGNPGRGPSDRDAM